jgi:predicted DNA-binding transcriptional regulator AlpA
LLRLDYRYVTEKVIFAPGFPKAIRVTPRSHRKWLLREIMAWIETRKEAA